jgi:hypothetical protein
VTVSVGLIFTLQKSFAIYIFMPAGGEFMQFCFCHPNFILKPIDKYPVQVYSTYIPEWGIFDCEEIEWMKKEGDEIDGTGRKMLLWEDDGAFGGAAEEADQPSEED